MVRPKTGPAPTPCYLYDLLVGGHLYYTLNPSKLKNPKVGKGIIIVNESFDEHEELLREGAEKDKENFEAIFDKLGICYEGRSHKNLTTGEMWKNLEKFANSEVLEDSVLFVAISTHSEHMGEITGTDNVPISLSHIYNFFYKNTELLNIPKVFLIEASKVTASKMEADYHPPSIRLEKFKSQDFPSATVISDTLIVHSSLDSRDKEDGSSFIKELRDCIHNPEYESMHLADIITICTNTVITNCSKSEEDCSITIQSTLRKKLRF